MTRLAPHGEGIPVPVPSAVSRPFWDGCALGELRYQRCDACDGALFDPASHCRRCGSTALRWERSRGDGAVSTWSTVWRPAAPEFVAPYCAAIVDVDEGYQILANVIGCAPDDVHRGLRVQVEFHPIGQGFSLPYFRPIDASARQDAVAHNEEERCARTK